MNHTLMELASKITCPDLAMRLEFLVLTGHPNEKAAHRGGELSFLGSLLTLAQSYAIHVSRAHWHDENSSTETVAPGHFFSCCEDERSWRLGRAGASVSAQAATALMVSRGAEQPFGYAFEHPVADSAGRGEIVHNQQSVLGGEGQTLEGVRS